MSLTYSTLFIHLTQDLEARNGALNTALSSATSRVDELLADLDRVTGELASQVSATNRALAELARCKQDAEQVSGAHFTFLLISWRPAVLMPTLAIAGMCRDRWPSMRNLPTSGVMQMSCD